MDMDGTVCGADHVLSPYTVEILNQLAPVGIAGVIVTGRNEKVAVATARQAGLTAPVISCNGAIVTDPTTGERLWLKHMDREEVENALRVSRECGVSVSLWTPDAWYIEEENPATDLLTILLEQPPTIRSVDEVGATQPVVKVMIGGSSSQQLDEVADVLEARIPGMRRSMPLFYEAAPKYATKAEAMQFVLGVLGVSAESVWGFGDGENDLGWLAQMGRVLVPVNGRERVKAIADELIGHHAEDGVARYIADHVLG